MTTSTAAGTRPGRVRRLVLALIVALAALTGSLSVGAERARADTPDWQITHVYLNLIGTGPTAQSQYTGFIQSLRNASGHPFRGSTEQTQYNPYGLVQVTLSTSDGTLTLWIAAQNMYVLGYTAGNGITYGFSDTAYGGWGPNNAYGNPMGFIPYLSSIWNQYGGGQSLAFGSNYNSMTQAAGRGRESMPISWTDLWYSYLNLLQQTNPYGNNQQNTARSLMLMIQYTSESARFWDVFGVMSAVMGNSGTVYNGLPIEQQYLENSWDAMSHWGQLITQNPGTPPLSVNGIGTLYSWGDAARYLALMLAVSGIPYTNGNWATSEI
ncbi:ribosome-inactivating family protein [Kitasatospora sp. NPDC052896]|uniref:ribosome-inactivating family protein n=1 Tax=Kitasatospora sp. NPDC052896 TaxID=3364061 RepID=UPI0037CC820C